MAKQPFTFDSNLDKVIVKVQEKPRKVMSTIGQTIVKEIKSTTLKSQYKQRYKLLSKTLGYWARKKEGDLQIGFKMSIEKNAAGAGPGIVGGIMSGREPDPIKAVVVKNAPLIQDMVGKALDEIRKE